MDQETPETFQEYLLKTRGYPPYSENFMKLPPSERLHIMDEYANMEKNKEKNKN